MSIWWIVIPLIASFYFFTPNIVVDAQFREGSINSTSSALLAEIFNLQYVPNETGPLPIATGESNVPREIEPIPNTPVEPILTPREIELIPNTQRPTYQTRHRATPNLSDDFYILTRNASSTNTSAPNESIPLRTLSRLNSSNSTDLIDAETIIPIGNVSNESIPLDLIDAETIIPIGNVTNSSKSKLNSDSLSQTADSKTSAQIKIGFFAIALIVLLTPIAAKIRLSMNSHESELSDLESEFASNERVVATPESLATVKIHPKSPADHDKNTSVKSTTLIGSKKNNSMGSISLNPDKTTSQDAAVQLEDPAPQNSVDMNTLNITHNSNNRLFRSTHRTSMLPSSRVQDNRTEMKPNQSVKRPSTIANSYSSSSDRGISPVGHLTSLSTIQSLRLSNIESAKRQQNVALDRVIASLCPRDNFQTISIDENERRFLTQSMIRVQAEESARKASTASWWHIPLTTDTESSPTARHH